MEGGEALDQNSCKIGHRNAFPRHVSFFPLISLLKQAIPSTKCTEKQGEPVVYSAVAFLTSTRTLLGDDEML